MNDIRIFNNPTFGEIRTVILNGEPWFVGNDIAKALGYAKPQNAISTHCRHALKQGIGVQTGNKADGTPSIQNVEMLIIPEGDMYRLISKSKLKSAEQFEEWVFDEVLPTIRKTGSYGNPQFPIDPMEMLEIHYAALKQVDKKVADVGNKVETLEDRFNKFEEELPMLPDDADEVHDALNKRVVFLLGGGQSNAYKDKSLTKKVFIDAYRVLKYNFGVTRYKAIKRNQKSKALQVIEEYKPPVFLAEQIETANAQQRLDV